MTDDLKSGIALIAGSVGGIVTMAIHPRGGGLTADQLVHLAVRSAAAHSLAIVSFVILFLGTCGLVKRIAARYQIRGYVKNLPDGRVEALVEGPDDKVEAFKHDLATGPEFSEVERLEELVLDPSGRYSAFRIER